MKQKKEEEERIKDGIRRWENGVKGMIKKGAALLRPPSFAKTDNLGLAEQEHRWWLLLPPWLSRMVGEVGQFLLGGTHDVVFGALWTGQAKLVFLLGANMCASKMAPISGIPLKHPCCLIKTSHWLISTLRISSSRKNPVQVFDTLS